MYKRENDISSSIGKQGNNTMSNWSTVALAVLLVVSVATATLPTKQECEDAAVAFVQDYNENAGDKHVKELDRVTGCWSVSGDLHLSLIMKTGSGYYKACLNVVAEKQSSKILSYGTCR